MVSLRSLEVFLHVVSRVFAKIYFFLRFTVIDVLAGWFGRLTSRHFGNDFLTIFLYKILCSYVKSVLLFYCKKVSTILFLLPNLCVCILLTFSVTVTALDCCL